MISFEDDGWNDYLYWQHNDKTLLRKINQLIKDIQRDPFDGIGKPEALRHNLTGFWSRRITDEHRLVYRVEEDGLGVEIFIAQCRGNYE